PRLPCGTHSKPWSANTPPSSRWARGPTHRARAARTCSPRSATDMLHALAARLEPLGITAAVLLHTIAEHIELTALAVVLAVLVGIPLGVHIARERFLAGPVLAFVSTLQTIPSIALLGFLIPFFGIGAKPAILALFLYALLPIVRNTYTGITQVDAAAIEAA